jgi:hypothetical protein
MVSASESVGHAPQTGVYRISYCLAAAQCKMRRVTARWFHTAIALYLLSMDILYAVKVIQLLSARTDLLWAHYRGLGLQFFTVWSQVRFICTS